MRYLFTVILVLAGLVPPVHAITNGHEPPCPSPLDAVAAFGAPSAGTGQYGNATLTDPWHVQLDQHLLVYGPLADYYEVRFRRPKPDDTGCTTWENSTGVRIVGFYRSIQAPGEWVMGTLENPVLDITPIPFVSPGDAGVVLQAGTPVEVTGWGKRGPWGQGPQGEMRVCRTWLVIVQTYGEIWTPGAQNPEGPGCGVNQNDSGGAVVAMVHGFRRLIGGVWRVTGDLQYDIHWGVQHYLEDYEYMGQSQPTPVPPTWR